MSPQRFQIQSLKVGLEGLVDLYRNSEGSYEKYENLSEAIKLSLDCYNETPADYGLETIEEVISCLYDQYPAFMYEFESACIKS